MNILVLAVKVPYSRGGAEVLVEQLVRELRFSGHVVDTIELPFSALPKERIVDSILSWRGLDLSNFSGRDVDLVIATKFPAYCVSHPNKVIWLIHQHRQAYDLYTTRFGDFANTEVDETLRQMIITADRQSFAEARSIYTISPVVTDRLQKYLNVKAQTLCPPPPLVGRYYGSFENGDGSYVLSVGRLCSIKRPDLLIKALPLMNENLRAVFVGIADEPGYQQYLDKLVEDSRLQDRVKFLGRVSDEELLALYAKANCVYYAPYDEDYGFVTLEAFASQRPVVTTTDSGGVCAFVRHGINGLVVPPKEHEIAAACDRLLASPIVVVAGGDYFATWPQITEALLS